MGSYKWKRGSFKKGLAFSVIREAREEGFETRKIRSCGGLFWVDSFTFKNGRGLLFGWTKDHTKWARVKRDREKKMSVLAGQFGEKRKGVIWFKRGKVSVGH